MADNRVQMPASTAGLTRFFDDYRSKIEFRPGQVVVMAISILMLTILLHMYGSAFLGV
ncbi:preprotein translocase subunit Sec61beta [Candidatus Woesearchaeota archaeon]|nr:preprotein translocase subunit Sec61beta [Candidatus Woesearchaeota archaeon]